MPRRSFLGIVVGVDLLPPEANALRHVLGIVMRAWLFF